MASTQTTDLVQVADAFIKAFDAGDWQGFKAPLSPNVAYEETGTGRHIHGADAYVQLAQGWKHAFPDATGTIHRAIHSGNIVVQEVTWKGTHTGDLVGPDGTIPPSGKRRITMDRNLSGEVRPGIAKGEDTMTNASAFKPNYPNNFELAGEGIRIVYTIDFAGETRLYYNGVSYKSEEIQSVTTPIGTLLTVPVWEPRLPGSGRRTLTLLLPDINMTEREHEFKTLAILTTHLTDGGLGPVAGPLQTYQAVALKGIASIIYTLQQDA